MSSTPMDIDTSVPVFTASINSNSASSNIAQLSQWLQKYVDVNTMTVDVTSMPELIILAQQRMYQRAVKHESEVGGNLFDLVRARPNTAYWANGGSSSDFLIQTLQTYGINAHRVNLWHTINDAHIAVEYQSVAFGKLVFYDPLYGVAMLNSRGIPASMDDLLGEFAGRGLNFSEWDFQPVLLGSPDGAAIPNAADPRYAEFLARDYRQILKYYFQIVSVAVEDYTPQQGLIPGEAVARGRWLVYDQIPLLSEMSVTEERTFLDEFHRRFSIEQDGRYYLTGQRLVDATPLTLDQTFKSTASAFGLFWGRVEIGPTTDAQRNIWQFWLSRYVDLSGTTLSVQNSAELLISAQRTMFVRATMHEQDVSGELVRLAMANPANMYWANCSSSSDFLLAGMRALGVPAHRVTLWHTQTDSHEAIEYYNTTYGKYTFYDPLYGTKMVDAAGVPAGFDDLQEQIQKYGFDSHAWRYQPQKVAIFSGNSLIAVDLRYQYFNLRDYHEILRYYLNFTAVRYEDYTPQQGFLAGSKVARGKWMFYDASRFSQEFTDEQRRAIRDALFATYSVDHQGRYYLTNCDAILFGDQTSL